MKPIGNDHERNAHEDRIHRAFPTVDMVLPHSFARLPFRKKCKQGTAHRLQKRETRPLSRTFSQFSIFLSSKMIIIITTVTSN